MGIADPGLRPLWRDFTRAYFHVLPTGERGWGCAKSDVRGGGKLNDSLEPEGWGSCFSRSQKRDLHPTDEDLSAGTPDLHPTDEDLSAGTPDFGHPPIFVARLHRDGWARGRNANVHFRY